MLSQDNIETYLQTATFSKDINNLYAFYGQYRDGVDGVYYLTAAGVLAEHRSSSEMLKRLVISSMHELATRSPFGRLQTLVTQQDPKLIEILESVGFRRRDAYPAFIKRPE